MFMEALDARRLMAAASKLVPPHGLDTTFGTGGQVTFPEDFLEQGPIATSDGAIFVAGEMATAGEVGMSTPYIVRLKSDGTIDKTFGKKGYAALPFVIQQFGDDLYEPSDFEASFAFDQLTVDGASGRIYVAADTRAAYGQGVTLNLTLLRSDGTVNPHYGDGGTFSYAPPVPNRNASQASAVARAIDPLADGSVVLAVDRQTRTGDYTSASDQSLALFRLRPNGTRDKTYGKNGSTELLSGTVGPIVFGEQNSSNRRVRRAFFNDVRTDKHGVTRVLRRYEDGVAESFPEASAQDDNATAGLFGIKARTVAATGKQDASQAYSWTLLDTGTDAAALQTTHYVPYAAPDGNRFRALVTPDPTEGPVTLYTLSPGKRPKKQPLVVEGLDHPVAGLLRSTNGQYFAVTSDAAVRLNRDFTQDQTFGNDGVADEGGNGGTIFINVGVFEASFSFQGVQADDQGRLLALGGYGFDRFA